MPYEESHWDRAINHYREIERRDWTDPLVPEILQRIRRAAFRPDDDLMGPTHCLDVAEYGYVVSRPRLPFLNIILVLYCRILIRSNLLAVHWPVFRYFRILLYDFA